jgi:hypothetical protein
VSTRKISDSDARDQEEKQSSRSRRAILTGGAVGLAAVAGTALVRPQAASATTLTPSVDDWINVTNNPAFGTGSAPAAALGNGSNDDSVAINYALNTLAKPGQVVYLPGPTYGTSIAGTYLVKSPVTIPSGVILAGCVPCGEVASGLVGDYGSTLMINNTWTSGGEAVVLINGSSQAVDNPVVKDLWIAFASNAPAGVHGIASNGGVEHAVIDRVGIAAPTGKGIYAYMNGTAFPDGWTITNVIVEQPGSDGVHYEGSDCFMSNVHAQNGNTNGTGDGFYISGGNNRLIGCRADSCNNGFTIEDQLGQPFQGTAAILVGCGTENNNANGLNVLNSSTSDVATTVMATGCSFQGDGGGGTTYAGISVTGPSIVILTSCNVFVHQSGGAANPEYALSFGSSSAGYPALIQAVGGFWSAASTSVINTPATYTTKLSYSVHGYGGGKFGAGDTVLTLQLNPL